MHEVGAVAELERAVPPWRSRWVARPSLTPWPSRSVNDSPGRDVDVRPRVHAGAERRVDDQPRAAAAQLQAQPRRPQAEGEAVAGLVQGGDHRLPRSLPESRAYSARRSRVPKAVRSRSSMRGRVRSSRAVVAGRPRGSAAPASPSPGRGGAAGAAKARSEARLRWRTRAVRAGLDPPPRLREPPAEVGVPAGDDRLGPAAHGQEGRAADGAVGSDRVGPLAGQRRGEPLAVSDVARHHGVLHDASSMYRLRAPRRRPRPGAGEVRVRPARLGHAVRVDEDQPLPLVARRAARSRAA